MRTPLQEARRRRLRVTLYYASGMQFIIRLFMGVGIFMLLRLAIYAFLTRRYGLPFYLCEAPYELVVLVFTALLLLLLPWTKGGRLHFLASLWMPAAACFVIVDGIRFLAGAGGNDIAGAVWGTLPYLLPLTVFIIIWLLDPRSRRIQVILSVMLVLLCAFWISDMPRTLRQARELHDVAEDHKTFYRQLRTGHAVPYGDLPQKQDSRSVHTSWTFRAVDPQDYRIAGSGRQIATLAYVEKLDIVIPGRYEGLPYSEQALHFETLEEIEYHYFYKYRIRRHIVLRDFYFSGDPFYRAVYGNGEEVFLDNVAVRKK
ncbi:MAG: hypothetical protein U5N26_08540 [Candidatus Marinimicrobia bacterium]|nr:hypothetical protein [Candidatus Neomarinimicrobiota bacterium]